METKNIRIWVESLEAYNNGNRVGGWIELPLKEEELTRVLGSILKGDKEILVSDWEVPKDLSCVKTVMDTFVNPKELNTVAYLCHNMDEQERAAVNAYVDYMNISDLKELANVIIQGQEIPFYSYDFEGMDQGRCSLEKMLGYTIFEQLADMNTGLKAALKLPGITLENYIDYEAIGRDFRLSGDVELYDMGYFDCVNLEGIDLNCYSWKDVKEIIQEREAAKTEPVIREEKPRKNTKVR